MYRYDEFDATLVAERVAQFRRQVKRRLAGELDEDQFRPLRLMNGLYLQLHAYMPASLPVCRRELTGRGRKAGEAGLPPRQCPSGSPPR
jgi:hypothetical protein